MSNKAVVSNINATSTYKSLFKPASWITKVDFINHLVLFNNVLLTVLADKKGGKTSFIQVLSEKLDSQISYSILSIDSALKVADLAKKITSQLELSEKSNFTLSEAIAKINERKKPFLLIIDNAQHLDDACLKEMLHEIKKQGKEGAFHACLVADFTLSKRLRKLSQDLYPNMIHSIEPGCLNEEETKTYLMTQFALGKQIEKQFSQAQIESVYKVTGGDVARINQMVDAFFNKPIKTKKSKKRFPRFVYAASIGAIGLGAGYLWQHQDGILSTNVPSKQVVELPQPKLLTQSIKQEPVKVKPAPKILVSQVLPLHIASQRQQVQPPPLTKIFEAAFDTDEDYSDELAVIDKVLVAPKNLSKVQIKQQPDLTSQVAKIQFPKGAVKKATIASSVIKSSHPKGYTIQIIASRNKAEALRFIKAHPSASLRKAKRNGLEWYVLTVGEYQNMNQAKYAMNMLPGELAQLKPWIRPLSGLKTA